MESSAQLCFKSVKWWHHWLLWGIRSCKNNSEWSCSLLQGLWCDSWKEPSDQLTVSFVLVPCPASPSWTDYLYNSPTSSENSLFILHPLKLVKARVNPHTLYLPWFPDQPCTKTHGVLFCFFENTLTCLVSYPRLSNQNLWAWYLGICVFKPLFRWPWCS